MELLDALRSTGAARAFTDEPVADDVVYAVLDDARFAPSGGNRQPWRVVVVADRDRRRALASLMQPVWDEYVTAGAARGTPFAFGLGVEGAASFTHAPNPLLDQLDAAPVVLAVAVDLRQVAMMDAGLPRPPVTGGASIYPFCWSILLAARARGLGGVLTTFAARVEPHTGPLLGLPDDHGLAAVIVLGHVERHLTRLRRQPVEAFACLDRFDGPPFRIDAEG